MALPSRRLQWWAQGALVAGCVGLDPGWLLGAFTLVLVLVAALKLLEAQDRAGRRLVALLQLVGCGLLAAQLPDLLPSLVQLLAAVLALAGLLQLESGQRLAWRVLLQRSVQVLTAALPMALVLFLLVPRVGPFGTGLGGAGARGATGLSDSLDPGSIAALVSDEAPAARVAFSRNQPPPPEQRYWRLLVHSRFTGGSWERDPEAETRRPTPVLPPGGDSRDTSGNDQIWLVEPSRFSAVPWDGRARPLEPNLRPEPTGELRLLRPALERRSYRLLELTEPLGWRRQPPSGGDLMLPAHQNPRLLALGRGWAALPDPAARLEAARAWFGSQTFRYTTTPGALPARDGLDVFLFDRREGFCGHYASAFSALMRAAGVPSRVVSGYLGGTWVEPISGASYLELRQSDAHAWSELWLPGVGWQRVDPTSWARGSATWRADAPPAQPGPSWPLERPWMGQWRWLQRQWWGLDMAWSRWWLGFDRSQQQALLSGLLGADRWALGWLVLAGVGAGLAFGLGLMQRRNGRSVDPPSRDLDALLRQLKRLGIEPEAAETLEALITRTGETFPGLAAPLAALAAIHNERRYAPALTAAAQRQARRRWQLALREVKRWRIDAISPAQGSER
jgi:transglutaminase-like putative cysteine protease